MKESFGCDGQPGAYTDIEHTDAIFLYGHNMPETQTVLPYVPPLEEPDDDYPLRLTTGRTVYHFHTRTKTGRARELEAAAPGAWVELAAADAEALGIADGDPVRVESRRGWIEAPARIERTRPREGTVFVPFHYGYWDAGAAGPDDDGREPRAANELTLTWWDPVSKQPIFKTSAVRVRRAETQ